jgi:uncharacterized membrane protein YeaQ/YmgE (transglycosylase-associated protein family)
MLVLAGLMAGWVGEAASRAGGYRFVLDMVLGLIGSVVGGAIVWVLISSDVSMLAMLLIGCGGAALTIVGQRRLWRSALASPSPGRLSLHWRETHPSLRKSISTIFI